MAFLKDLVLKVQSMNHYLYNRHSAANLGINYLIESTE